MKQAGRSTCRKCGARLVLATGTYNDVLAWRHDETNHTRCRRGGKHEPQTDNEPHTTNPPGSSRTSPQTGLAT